MSEFARIMVVTVFIMFASQAVTAATFTVTKIADTNDGVCDADCSLREAIAAANASGDADDIVFASLFSTAQTITLSGTEIVIANSGALVINGSGADRLTVSGNNVSRIISTSPAAFVTINNARFTGGNGVGAAATGRAGAIYNNGGNLTLNNLVITANTANTGGALNNAGTATLTVNNCFIFGNTSASSGGAMQNFAGNTLIINNSTISGNTSGGGTGGGGIQANGTVFISNSTFAGNNAPGGSGGGVTFNGTAITFNNVTISNNTATTNGGGFHRTGSNPVNFRNTIIAGNNGVSTSPDVTGTITSNGNNIIGNIGTSIGWIGADLQNVNPMLGALANNGGLGNTLLPLAGSPAIDAGQNCVVDLSCAAGNPPTAITTDQRGIARPSNAIVDIGAVEVAAIANVSVGGRVVSDTGQPMPNTLVFLNSGNITRSTRTNTFGFYTFDNVPSGSIITVGVQSKAFVYSSQNVTVSGQITNLNFSPAL